MAWITTVRGRLREDDPTRARDQHNEIVDGLRERTAPLGGTGHMVFASAEDPREFLAVDRWESLEGLQQFMGDPATGQAIGGMFDGPPQVTVWAEREGWTAF